MFQNVLTFVVGVAVLVILCNNINAFSFSKNVKK